jgi:hypothetical protein
MPSSDSSSVIALKPEAKCTVYAAAILFAFYRNISLSELYIV